MKTGNCVRAAAVVVLGFCATASLSGAEPAPDRREQGRRLFEQETFGGNGRTCRTCHSRNSGTVSPSTALARLQTNPLDPLFLHDGSDDGLGHGVSRMLADATILVKIQLPPNVRLANSPDRFVVLRRGIPTTLNTPALDPVLMLDGRQATLELQAGGAIADHTQTTSTPSLTQLEDIRQFESTAEFFSSPALKRRAAGGPVPKLPLGVTDSQRRGRVFFEEVAPDPSNVRRGLCAQCHSGTLLNQTNQFASQFLGFPVPTGSRFQNVRVSELNQAQNPEYDFIFTQGGTDFPVRSADPGRALISGLVEDVNAFKIPQLRGIRRTAPYFHDNSAKTLEAVLAHYVQFFGAVKGINLTPQDETDIVAFLQLLD